MIVAVVVMVLSLVGGYDRTVVTFFMAVICRGDDVGLDRGNSISGGDHFCSS